MVVDCGVSLGFLGPMCFPAVPRRGRGGGAEQNLPCAALLDLGDVELEEAVQPLNEFLPVGGCLSAFALQGAAGRSRPAVARGVG